MVSPDREQGVRVAGVFDAHDQPGRGAVFGGSESSVSDFGDLGIGDPFIGVRVADRARVFHRCPRVVGDRRNGALFTAVFFVSTSENLAPARSAACTTLRVP